MLGEAGGNESERSSRLLFTDVVRLARPRSPGTTPGGPRSIITTRSCAQPLNATAGGSSRAPATAPSHTFDPSWPRIERGLRRLRHGQDRGTHDPLRGAHRRDRVTRRRHWRHRRAPRCPRLRRCGTRRDSRHSHRRRSCSRWSHHPPHEATTPSQRARTRAPQQSNFSTLLRGRADRCHPPVVGLPGF